MSFNIDQHGSDAIIVVVEFALNPGREEDFQEAVDSMRERVKLYEGFLGEEPCRNSGSNMKANKSTGGPQNESRSDQRIWRHQRFET